MQADVTVTMPGTKVCGMLGHVPGDRRGAGKLQPAAAVFPYRVVLAWGGSPVSNRCERVAHAALLARLLSERFSGLGS
jgi:hypothetical protein